MRSWWAAVIVAAAACGERDERPGPVALDPVDAGGPIDAAAPPPPPPEDPGRPLPEPDLSFVLPYEGDPQVADLELEVDVRRLDVHFSVDTTASFTGEIGALQTSLRNVVVPGLRARVADATLGVSRFEDFPVPPFGAPEDRPFRLLQRQTSDESRAVGAVRLLSSPLGNGLDNPESSGEALYQIATGDGIELDGTRIVDPLDREEGEGSIGGAGFREGALPVVVQVTDAPSHTQADYEPDLPAHSVDEITDALRDIDARVLGIASGEAARPDLERMARETGAIGLADEDGRCATGIDGTHRPAPAYGCPLVYDIDPEGEGLSETVVDGVEALLASIVFDAVTIVILDDTIGFVREATPLEAIAPAGTVAPPVADLEPPGGDGLDDSFLEVRPGTLLRFRLVVRNERLREADYEQLFFLRALLLGDGTTVLAERIIGVTVPARPRGLVDGG